MNAKNSSGEGGTPFIQALNTNSIDSGVRIWRQEYRAPEFRETVSVSGIIRDAEFRETSLVSGIIKAPDYGYVLALCEMSGGIPAKPFKIVRVNERGLLIK